MRIAATARATARRRRKPPRLRDLEIAARSLVASATASAIAAAVAIAAADRAGGVGEVGDIGEGHPHRAVALVGLQA